MNAHIHDKGAFMYKVNNITNDNCYIYANDTNVLLFCYGTIASVEDYASHV
ncbi:TPA: hypothetical protein QCY13_004178 [Bacillus paranthracis]|nr:hypothetical protein [Bacillus paranthracis]